MDEEPVENTADTEERHRTREPRERPRIPTRRTRAAHPQVVNYKRTRYGPPHVYALDRAHPRGRRPPE